MALISRFFRNEVKEIIDLTNENAELKRGIGDLFLLIDSQKHENLHVSIRNSDPMLRHLFILVRQIIEENRLLQSEQIMRKPIKSENNEPNCRSRI